MKTKSSISLFFQILEEPTLCMCIYILQLSTTTALLKIQKKAKLNLVYHGLNISLVNYAGDILILVTIK